MRKWLLNDGFMLDCGLIAMIITFIITTLIEGWKIGFVISLVGFIAGSITGIAIQMVYTFIMDTIEYRNYLEE